MPAPKWFVVARNEYRIYTSRIRMIRRFFPYLTVGLLAVFVGYVAPRIVAAFVNEVLAFFLSQAALAMVDIVLFSVFFYFIILPITYTLREAQTKQLEIFLAAPIKPSDVLLGEFLGVVPFYSIAIAIIAGFFTAVLDPLGLDFAQKTIVIIIFIVTFLSALWIGTVIAAVLRTKIGKTARGQDIGKGLAMVVALPLVGLMYAAMGGGLFEALANPGTSGMIEAVLGLLPSSWGAEVIISFAKHPGNIGAAGFEMLTGFGALLVFFGIVLWMGTKVAGRAYSLETTTFSASVVKPDGAFYKTIKSLGGGGLFGTILVSVFKDYSRRLENTSKIVYIVGLYALITVFLADPGDFEGGLIMSQLILPLLSAFVVGEVTLRGKENLFIFKKTPSGVGRFIKARLLHGWLIVVPVAVGVTAASLILRTQVEPIVLLTYLGLLALTVMASVTFVLGLFLLNPAFSDKSAAYMINIVVMMQGWIMLTLVPVIALAELLNLTLIQAILFVTTPLSWAVAIVMLYLGKIRLERIE